MAAAADASLDVWLTALYSVARHNAVLDRLVTIKELGWRMREYAGQQRNIVAAAIASDSAILAACKAGSR